MAHFVQSLCLRGYVLRLESVTQRKKLENFEGEQYKPVHLTAQLMNDDGQDETIEADMYLWNGDMDVISSEPWDLDRFIAEHLEDWIDLFEGMEMIGDWMGYYGE